MKKVEAINALKDLQRYINQNQCFEVFKPKNDTGKQNRLCEILNQLSSKAEQEYLWADEQNRKDVLDGKPCDWNLLELRTKKKAEWDEFRELASWVACLPYSSEY